MTDSVAEPRVVFRADGGVDVIGPIVRGGQLTIDYAISRLPDLRRYRHQIEVRRVDAFIKFAPANEVTELSLLEAVYSKDFTPVVIGHLQRPVTVTVPPDATSVELWFRTRDGFPEGLEHWDSRYGQNYVFPVQ